MSIVDRIKAQIEEVEAKFVAEGSPAEVQQQLAVFQEQLRAAEAMVLDAERRTTALLSMAETAIKHLDQLYVVDLRERSGLVAEAIANARVYRLGLEPLLQSLDKLEMPVAGQLRDSLTQIQHAIGRIGSKAPNRKGESL